MSLLGSEVLISVLRAAVAVVLCFISIRLIHRSLARSKRLTPQQAMLTRRLASALLLTIAAIWALRELGFQLGPLLGAAGLLTVAIGFAAQTSVSNLISGLFLIGERPFVVGDLIRVGDTTGLVLSVDLMSVKLRTFDNLLVRIPNETMLKSNVTNLTHFPIRRVDVKLGVAYKEQIAHVKRVLLEVADRNPICLEEPKPLIIFLGFGESSLDFQLSVWAKASNFLDLKNSIYEEIKAVFDAEGIEIPFPHRTLYTGVVTDPFPVRIVGSGTTATPPEQEEPAPSREADGRRSEDGATDEEEGQAPREAT